MMQQSAYTGNTGINKKEVDYIPKQNYDRQKVLEQHKKTGSSSLSKIR